MINPLCYGTSPHAITGNINTEHERDVADDEGEYGYHEKKIDNCKVNTTFLNFDTLVK